MRLGLKFHPDHQRLVWITLIVFGVITALSLLLFFFGPPFLPLWYSLAVVEEQLASREWVFSLPLLAFFILLVSLWFGRHTALDHERYVAAISLWSGISLLALLLLALLRIIKVTL